MVDPSKYHSLFIITVLLIAHSPRMWTPQSGGLQSRK